MIKRKMLFIFIILYPIGILSILLFFLYGDKYYHGYYSFRLNNCSGDIIKNPAIYYPVFGYKVSLPELQANKHYKIKVKVKQMIPNTSEYSPMIFIYQDKNLIMHSETIDEHGMGILARTKVLDSDKNGVFEFDTWTTYHKSIFEIGVIDTIKTGKENVFDKIFNREINLTYD